MRSITTKHVHFFRTVLMSISLLISGGIGNSAWAAAPVLPGQYHDGSLTWKTSNGDSYSYDDAKGVCEKSELRLPTQTEIETFYQNNLGNIENNNIRIQNAMKYGLKNGSEGVWAQPDQEGDGSIRSNVFFLGQGRSQGCYTNRLPGQQESSCSTSHQAFCVTPLKNSPGDDKSIWRCPYPEELNLKITQDSLGHKKLKISGFLTSSKGNGIRLISTEPEYSSTGARRALYSESYVKLSHSYVMCEYWAVGPSASPVYLDQSAYLVTEAKGGWKNFEFSGNPKTYPEIRSYAEQEITQTVCSFDRYKDNATSCEIHYPTDGPPK